MFIKIETDLDRSVYHTEGEIRFQVYKDLIISKPLSVEAEEKGDKVVPDSETKTERIVEAEEPVILVFLNVTLFGCISKLPLLAISNPYAYIDANKFEVTFTGNPSSEIFNGVRNTTHLIRINVQPNPTRKGQEMSNVQILPYNNGANVEEGVQVCTYIQSTEDRLRIYIKLIHHIPSLFVEMNPHITFDKL